MRKVLRGLWKIITAPFRFIVWLVYAPISGVRKIFGKFKRFLTYDEEDAPITEAFSRAAQDPQSIFYHIDTLRKHLLRAVFIVFLSTALSFFFVQQILTFLTSPLEGGLAVLQAIEVTENVGTVFRVSLLSGFAIAFPYVVLEIWLFIAPGLRPPARIRGMISIPVATVLFLLGMIFAFYVMLPVALPFLFNFMGLSTVPRPSSYFNFVTRILFWIGFSFEFPLVIYILAELGVVKAKTLATQWRLAIVIIAILAAAITPTVDPVSMFLVMGPMILLYLLGIGLAFFSQRGKS